MNQEQEKIEELTVEQPTEEKCNCENCECHHDKKKKKNKHKKEEELTLKIAELEKLNQELTDKVKLAQAELVNYRRRKDEETANMLKYSNQNLIMEILPILDNFERAIKLDDNNLEDELSKFLNGFKMIYTNLIEVLNKYEVKEIEALGKEFDPTYHQAVLTDKDESKASGTILEVLQKGYMYKDKVIRVSMVKVNE